MKRLKIVLDTNVFLVMLAPTYRLHWIFQSLIDGRFELLVSNEILTEYQEIIALRYGLSQTDSKLDSLLLLENVHLVAPTWRWNLISDPDDNKFVDCALVGGADFIVSNDRAFRVLKEVGFPLMRVFTDEEFAAQFKVSMLK